MKIVGLGYKTRSGKDTAGGVLARERSYKQLSFAAALKEAARVLFALSDEQLHGAKKEVVDLRWGATPRELLQRLGTEAMRKEFGADFWIRRLKMEIDALAGPKVRGVVVTDARFRNEVEAIKAWGGVVWRIDRAGAGASGGVVGHASETELDGWEGWDQIVTNDSTIFDFATKILALEAQL